MLVGHVCGARVLPLFESLVLVDVPKATPAALPGAMPMGSGGNVK